MHRLGTGRRGHSRGSRRLRRWAAAVLTVAVMTLTLLALIAMPTAQAATSELFFSEYIEGSSNNKALEIYNDTGAAVDLAAGGYNVLMSFNGGTSTLTINLTGVVADGDVYVRRAVVGERHDPRPGRPDERCRVVQRRRRRGPAQGHDRRRRDRPGRLRSRHGVGHRPRQYGGQHPPAEDDDLPGRHHRHGRLRPGSIEWDGFATDTFSGLGSHTASCGGGDLAAVGAVDNAGRQRNRCRA